MLPQSTVVPAGPNRYVWTLASQIGRSQGVDVHQLDSGIARATTATSTTATERASCTQSSGPNTSTHTSAPSRRRSETRGFPGRNDKAGSDPSIDSREPSPGCCERAQANRGLPRDHSLPPDIHDRDGDLSACVTGSVGTASIRFRLHGHPPFGGVGHADVRLRSGCITFAR